MGNRNRQFWYSVGQGVLFYLSITVLYVTIGPAIVGMIGSGSHPLQRPLAEVVTEEAIRFALSPPFVLVALTLPALMYGESVYRSQE